MASLAPGNGWFPQRADGSRHGGGAERRLALHTASNVYAFPGAANARAADHWRAASGYAIATRLAAILVADSIRAGKTARWALGWCLLSLVVASLMWVGAAGGLVAAALLSGMPWLTAAVAATVIHVLGTTLVVLMGTRIARGILLSVERRKQLFGKAA